MAGAVRSSLFGFGPAGATGEGSGTETATDASEGGIGGMDWLGRDLRLGVFLCLGPGGVGVINLTFDLLDARCLCKTLAGRPEKAKRNIVAWQNWPSVVHETHGTEPENGTDDMQGGLSVIWDQRPDRARKKLLIYFDVFFCVLPCFSVSGDQEPGGTIGRSECGEVFQRSRTDRAAGGSGMAGCGDQNHRPILAAQECPAEWFVPR